MSIPMWVLLGFAGWTILTLLTTVGVYRWSHILTGRSDVKHWRADKIDPSEQDWYKRAMRAHANCVENLPVYGAIVLVIYATGVESSTLDILAVTLLVARVIHTNIHVWFEQTNIMATFRFLFFFIQLVCMGWMGIWTAVQVAGG